MTAEKAAILRQPPSVLDQKFVEEVLALNTGLATMKTVPFRSLLGITLVACAFHHAGQTAAAVPGSIPTARSAADGHTPADEPKANGPARSMIPGSRLSWEPPVGWFPAQEHEVAPAFARYFFLDADSIIVGEIELHAHATEGRIVEDVLSEVSQRALTDSNAQVLAHGSERIGGRATPWVERRPLKRSPAVHEFQFVFPDQPSFYLILLTAMAGKEADVDPEALRAIRSIRYERNETPELLQDLDTWTASVECDESSRTKIDGTNASWVPPIGWEPMENQSALDLVGRRGIVGPEGRETIGILRVQRTPWTGMDLRAGLPALIENTCRPFGSARVLCQGTTSVSDRAAVWFEFRALIPGLDEPVRNTWLLVGDGPVCFMLSMMCPEDGVGHVRSVVDQAFRSFHLAGQANPMASPFTAERVSMPVVAPGRCSACQGRGRIACLQCQGSGRTRCMPCNGTGKRGGSHDQALGSCFSCFGNGSLTCIYCSGTTGSACISCAGSGRAR